METLYEQALLYDFYAGLLTNRQREVCRLHLQEDWSLSEIAEELHISRQGVSDALHKGLEQMEDMEGKLHMARRFVHLKSLAEEMEKQVKEKAPQDELEKTLKAFQRELYPSETAGEIHGI